MRMVLNEPLPVEVTDLLARRRALGLDRNDEVWNGEYHMNPAPKARHGRIEVSLHLVLAPTVAERGLHLVGGVNIGRDEQNFRVPDSAILRSRSDEAWLSDAAIVIEILSPGDETWQKFDHYWSFGVDEIFIVDPERRAVQIVSVEGNEAHSQLLGIPAASLAAQLDW